MAPVRNDLQSLNRHYFTQALKVNQQDVMLMTDWFYSKGVSKSTLDNKDEILIPLGETFMVFLRNIEEIAINNGLQLPSEFQTDLSKEQIFKRLPNRTSLYVKCAFDMTCFDKKCKSINREALQAGEFRAMIHIKGLYIGAHSNGKLVSLQMRVCQIQNVARNEPCLFNYAIPPLMGVGVPSALPKPIESNPVPPTPAPAKKTRKPKLQRQNAVAPDEMQSRVGAGITQDFFDNLDFDEIAAVQH